MVYFQDFCRHKSRSKVKPILSDNVQPRSFAQVMSDRKQQAMRSVLISYHSRIPDVCSWCGKYGSISHIYCFQRDIGNFALVEFKDKSSVDNLLHNAQFSLMQNHIPIRSRFLNLFHVPHKSTRFKSDYHLKMQVEVPFDDKQFLSELKRQCSLKSEMEYLHKSLSLNECGVRLRYFLSYSLEEIFKRVMPETSVSLFGSCINGFGKHNCDVDMLLHIHYKEEQEKSPSSFEFSYKGWKDSNLERKMSVNVLEMCGNMMKTLVPGVANVVNILRARIPIVKFYHLNTGLDCDLSVDVGNESATVMSYLLYHLGRMDFRILPLVFTIRHYVYVNQISSNSAGPWISNFSLTLMIIFFLQRRPEPILPPLNDLNLYHLIQEKRYEEIINAPVKKIVNDNTESIDILLREFFHYYSNFDFSIHGISLINGNEIKLKVSEEFQNNALYIENPIDTHLNVSQNVIDKYLKKFQNCCRQSLKVFEGKSNVSLIDLWTPSDNTDKTMMNNEKFDGKIIINNLFDKKGS